MIDIGEFFTDYLTKGHYRFNAAEVLSQFDLKLFGEIKKVDATFDTEDPEERYKNYTMFQSAELRALRDELSEKYFKELNHELRFNDMWSTANPYTYSWHNDTLRCWPGFNSNVNCYFDDMDASIGGALQMHPTVEDYDTIMDDSPMISETFPKKFDIIVINQNSNWLHRVRHTDHPRLMLSFSAAFFDINPVI
uniref:2OG-Fe(II) oxygenase n=1 Tax=Burkholderia phage vB_BgluM-SURPRISE13 TaxID=3159457 RepID=A0AAU7PFQ8_9VIRU